MMIKPEFSREYEVTRLTEGETELILEATVDERAKLAQRFNLEAITVLRAKTQVTVDSSEGLIDFAGIIEADINQACVVSLKPIQTHVEAQIFRRYSIISIPLDSPKEVDLNKENDDAPEPIEEGILDFGEIVAEQFGLEIDPFPRSPGSEFAGFSSNSVKNSPSEPNLEEDSNPFAILAQLKGSLKK